MVSTSLLIYVVLYKNELLSNLYVLLIKVLCFATSSSSSYPFSSSSSKPQNTRAILPRLSHGPLPSRFSWFGWLSPTSVCLCSAGVFVFECVHLYVYYATLTIDSTFVFKYYKSLHSLPSSSSYPDDSSFSLRSKKYLKQYFFHRHVCTPPRLSQNSSLVLDRE